MAQMKFEMLCDSDCPSVSTSFVILESISPVCTLSKYPIGMRSIFSEMSRLILYTIFWVTFVMMRAWMYCAMAPTKYSAMVIRRTFLTAAKSMPPVPWILFMTPSASRVVALPMTLGPSVSNMVANADTTMTTATANLYAPM